MKNAATIKLLLKYGAPPGTWTRVRVIEGLHLGLRVGLGLTCALLQPYLQLFIVLLILIVTSTLTVLSTLTGATTHISYPSKPASHPIPLHP